MNCSRLGYLFLFLYVLVVHVRKGSGKFHLGRRRKALAPEKQHYHMNRWGFGSTHAPEPEFVGGIPGIKVIAGKDAILRCVVENLGDYKVSWGVVNQKDQLSIGTNVFKGKDRIHVTHSDNSWYLHIKNVTQNDTGYYICQISTNPIKTQAGHLDVVDEESLNEEDEEIVDEELISDHQSNSEEELDSDSEVYICESTDDYVGKTISLAVRDQMTQNVTVMENTNVTLSCKATGNPPPEFIPDKGLQQYIFLLEKDKGEGGNCAIFKPTFYRLENIDLLLVSCRFYEYKNETLTFLNVNREHMAAYLCLANNEVPPAISRRIYLDVKFPPLIWIQNQLVGAPVGTDVYLECLTEAHPTSDNYWLRDDEAVVSKSTRYHPHITRNSYKTYMKLTIRNLQPEDYGSYQCVAKNTISETQGSIKLYRLVIPTPLPPKAVTEELLTYPTRKVITVSLTTEYRTLVTEIIRRDSMNSPGKQQKYGHGRVSSEEEAESSSERTNKVTVYILLISLLPVLATELDVDLKLIDKIINIINY
ncbi:Neurotrimin like protein [Argiope bruennichi]|uniref:Neurotrimin like protein n=1 Tax=Argiope bruennichi TaxID=94029 RepID=A0A8T0FMK1_ARGBR|nr:Neurotrimin like protein [Argiope bruennichi]